MIHIPKPLAILLKDKGYKEKCCAYYTGFNDAINYDIFKNTINYKDKNSVKSQLYELFSAPIHQEAVDFLREKHKTVVYVRKHYGSSGYLGFEGVIDYNEDMFITDTNEDYYDCYNKAIETALNLLPNKE